MKIKPNKFTLLIDMDEVIVEFLDLLLTRYNMFYNTKFTIEDIITYDFRPILGQKGMDICQRPGFFEYLKPKPDSIAVMKALQDEGYNLLIVTNSMGLPYVAAEKYEWIKKHMSFLHIDQVIMTAQKHLIRGHLIFDDHPDYLKSYPGFTVCMDRPYNRMLKGHRVHNWREFYNLIHDLFLEENYVWQLT